MKQTVRETEAFKKSKIVKSKLDYERLLSQSNNWGISKSIDYDQKQSLGGVL